MGDRSDIELEERRFDNEEKRDRKYCLFLFDQFHHYVEALRKRFHDTNSGRKKALLLLTLLVVLSGVLKRRPQKLWGVGRLINILRRSWLWAVRKKSSPIPITFSDALRKITRGGVENVIYSGTGSIEMEESTAGSISVARIVPGAEAALFASIARHVPHFQLSTSVRRFSWLPALFPFLLLALWWRIVRSIISSPDADFWHTKKDSTRLAFRTWRGLLGFPTTPTRNTKAQTTFDDVISSAKHEVFEVVDCLNHPTDFEQVGARIPRGLLLVGPSGQTHSTT